jgi:hypothetical protein
LQICCKGTMCDAHDRLQLIQSLTALTAALQQKSGVQQLNAPSIVASTGLPAFTRMMTRLQTLQNTRQADLAKVAIELFHRGELLSTAHRHCSWYAQLRQWTDPHVQILCCYETNHCY